MIRLLVIYSPLIGPLFLLAAVTWLVALGTTTHAVVKRRSAFKIREWIALLLAPIAWLVFHTIYSLCVSGTAAAIGTTGNATVEIAPVFCCCSRFLCLPV